MTDVTADGPPPAPKEDPESLVLRGRPRPAVRFRRGVIIAISAAFLVTLIGLTWIALEPVRFPKAAEAPDSDGPSNTSANEALANVPKNYGDVPRLGPPLPGDLGRTILEHERSIDAASGLPNDFEGRSPEGADPERQRMESDRQAARSSGVLVQLQVADGVRATPELSGPMPQPEAPSALDRATPVAAVAPDQQRKLDFVRTADGERDPHRLQAPQSPWLLSAGTIIPASLITGLNSDLPGMVIAQVTENVRDSATGRATLIPQGARLIGSYDSIVAYGQRRALLVWKRIVLPDGSSIGLDNMPATDAAGYAGLEGGVDFHTWRLLKGIGLSTLLGVGTQLSIGGGESDLLRALRESAQQNVAHAGDQITARNLEVQPTIKVNPGWPVRAIVNKDVVLRPWLGI